MQGGRAGDLYLVGAFVDERDSSRQVWDRLFGCLNESSFDFNLRLACIGPANTDSFQRPRCTELVLDTSSQTVFPGQQIGFPTSRVCKSCLTGARKAKKGAEHDAVAFQQWKILLLCQRQGGV